jgi:hypothetical protein
MGNNRQWQVMAGRVNSPQRPLAATGAALPFQSKCNRQGRLLADRVNSRSSPKAVGRRSRGYLALYRYVAEIDTVFVLALCSQREAGYTRT